MNRYRTRPSSSTVPSSSNWLQPKDVSFWTIQSNRKSYFDWVSSQLKIQSLEDWYNIRVSDIQAFSGGSLLNNYYGGSLIKALQNLYPNYKWQPWKFKKANHGYWNQPLSHRSFFDNLAQELNIQLHSASSSTDSSLSRSPPEGWYSIQSNLVYQYGGKGLLNSHYGNSLFRALQSVYPEYDWKPWRFQQPTRGYWEKSLLSDQREYLDWITRERLKLERPSDWQYITLQV